MNRYNIFRNYYVKRNLLLLITLIIVSTLLLTACGQIPGLMRGIDPPEPGDVLLEDDFSSNSNLWGIMERAGGDITIEYGGMIFSVYLPNFMFWSVTGGEYPDTRVVVDAVLVEGPVNDNFGVICRYQDEENFYGFLLSHDGYYGIFKYMDGNMIMTSAEGNLAYSEVIRQGGVVNHIEATCQGSTLSLTVNDTLLAAVEDDTFASGKVGLIAGAYTEPGVSVLFDNFKVYQP